jgi:dTDP-4-dehydrorhamnose reductase
MKVLVIGAGKLGLRVINQLRKNPRMDIVVADAHEKPEAVSEGAIRSVDVLVHVTPLNFMEVVDRVKPDLVILARTTEDWEQTDVPMGSEYVAGMEQELTRTNVAVLPVSERVMGLH